MTMRELADRVGVTEQAVRWWEEGRSYPRKKVAPLIEQALSFQIDWAEGRGDPNRTAAAMVDEGDMQLLLKIAKLPANSKQAFKHLVDVHLEAVERARSSTPAEPAPRAAPAPAPTPAPAKKSRIRA